MIPAKIVSAPEFPDDPRKWDGWNKYSAGSMYERLCLDPGTNPDEEEIQLHCSALLLWWQKKLPLKSQPTNPLAQLLGRGIDDAPRCLVEARTELLDPVRRREIDESLAVQAHQEALLEFAKYVAFTITGGVLYAEAEANLTEFGQRSGLSEEQIRECIDEQVRQNGARRATPAPAPAAPPIISASAATASPKMEFMRILTLSEADLTSATPSVRELFLTIAHNLGIEDDLAVSLLEDHLDQAELALARDVAQKSATVSVPAPAPVTAPAAKKSPSKPSATSVPERRPSGARPSRFLNPLNAEMVLIPGGGFLMGSVAIDAPPNEQPPTPVKLSEFYISRHLVTNAQYEQFDPAHRQKRMKGSGDQHPVVYVSSLDAIKFCQWLGLTDGKKYRLPTEAEWEYAARGTDGRRYPWGNHDNRADLGNFADASTTFAWRDPILNDGHAETSPVGAFPRGASFFGIEDMAGNVWEWCLDFYQPLPGTMKLNPRGGATGSARVHRGGSWKSRFANLRATTRASNAPNYSCNDLGFRVVCECARGETA